MKRPSVSPEDQALFLDAVRGAQPLAKRDRLAVPPPPPSPVAVSELPPEVKLSVEGDAQRYAARAPGVSLSQVAELRTGKVHLEATLDLHGATTASAIEQLRAFLAEARRVGRRRVLIVHGKGMGALREAVVADLLGPLSGLVHAFASAAPGDGGEGATIVMLRGGK